MLIPLLIAATVSVLIGIYPNFMMQFVWMVTG
jgi:multicomponent Na+:H+ antiporter subunit D